MLEHRHGTYKLCVCDDAVVVDVPFLEEFQDAPGVRGERSLDLGLDREGACERVRLHTQLLARVA